MKMTMRTVSVGLTRAIICGAMIAIVGCERSESVTTTTEQLETDSAPAAVETPETETTETENVSPLPDPEAAQANSSLEADSNQQCFRNEIGSGEAKDIEELIIAMEGTQATGEYNWIPAYKDRRMGEFAGQLTGNVVEATYTYEQEGNQASTPMAILVEDDTATIEGGDPALGLNATLSRVDCSQ